MVELPDDAIEQALVEGFGQARWDAMNGAEQHDARDLFGPMAASIAARVPAEAVAQLAEALGEPVETPGDHPGEPPYRVTWERALDIARGRTKVWLDLLQRAELADADWLSEYRRTSAPVQVSVADRIAEAVAGERQRIAAVAVELATITERAVVRGGYSEGVEERVETLWQQLGVVLAAGSVPAANSEPMRFKDTVPIEVDEAAAVAYVRLSDAPVARTGERVKDVALVDYASDGYPVGIEIHFAGPVATPTQPTPGSDEAYRLQQQLQAENRLVATLHGRSDPCMCPDCTASRVPAGQSARPEPDLLTALQRSLDRARAGQPAGDREAFDRRAGEEEAQAELLGHRLTVGEAVPAGQTRCIAPVDGFRCVHPAGHAGDHERCGDPGGGIGCPVPGCHHDVPADWPERRGVGGVGGHAPGCEGWRPPTALGHDRSVPQRCEPGCRAEQQEDQAEQPDGWGEGVEAADHPVNCSCSPCVIDRLRDSNDTLRDELSGAAGEIDRLRAELGLAPAEQPEER